MAIKRFLIDATDGKKWVKFAAMQQNVENLIYDLNTMKGTVTQPVQNSTVPSLKLQKTVLSHL